jgi:hypothetical protein
MSKTKIMNATKITFSLLIVFALFVSVDSARADVRYGFTVSNGNEGYPSHIAKGELKYAGTRGNLNIGNIDTEYPARINSSDPSKRWPSIFSSRGELLVTQSGSYKFVMEASPYHSIRMVVSDKDGNTKCQINVANGSCTTSLSVGTYLISTHYAPSVLAKSPFFRIKWGRDANTPVVIPSTSLTSKVFDNGMIRIPSGAAATEKMSYLVAGVGTRGAGSTAQIKMKLPTVIPESAIMTDNIWLIWLNDNNNPNINVKGSPIVGTWFTSGNGLKLGWLRRKLSASHMTTDGSGTITFSFSGLTSHHSNGLAVILPFKDPSKPKGFMEIRTSGEKSWLMASRPITFSDLSSYDLTKLSPFFIVPDGSSKSSSLFRPNYISYRAGTGAQPSENSFFRHINMLIPEIPGRITTANMNTSKKSWYPAFGRERAEMDVLARTENYAPNLATGSGDGGVLDFWAVPPATDWVSFQYNSSNFPQNQTTSPLGENENGSLAVIGLMRYENTVATQKLIICPPSSSFAQGLTQNLIAKYWASFAGTPNCSTSGFTTVTNDPGTAWFVNNGNIVESKGVIKGVNIGSSQVTASYMGLNAQASLNVISPTLCAYYVCNDTTGYRCEVRTATPPCPTNPSCTFSGDSCLDDGGWKEVVPK